MFLIYILLISRGAVKIEEHTNRQGVTVNFTISELKQEESRHMEMQFIELSISGTGIMYDVGKPNLPVIREFVEVPEDAELSIEADVLKEKEIKLPYPVYPKQPPIPKIPGYKPTFTIDRDYYTYDEFLPTIRAQIVELGELRGHRVAVLEVYPVQYNPSQNIINFAKEIKVTISFNGANWSKTSAKLSRYYSPYYESRLHTIINYDYFKQLIKGHSLPIGYLIITPDSWYSSVLPLADWKTQKGYYVTVAKLSQTGTTTNSILNYIKNAYDNWPVAPTFVLLVGDIDSIGYWTGGGVGGPPTDLNYSLMDTGNYFPDVDLSRLSVTNQVQLDSLIDKIIRYEKNAWSFGTAWCKKAYFVASADPSNHGIAEGTHLYCMAICRANGMSCDSLWTFGGWSGTPPNTAINDGRGWVMYSGHGSPQGWSDLGIIWGVSDVHSLSNTDKPAFVGTYACLSGDYTIPECFSESWLRVGRRGAIANFASSVSSYWEEDDTLQRRMFDAAFDSEFTWVMGMFNKSKLLFYTHFGPNSTTQRYFEMYNMMGDGSIDLYWDEPHPITVDYPNAIPIGPFSLKVTVKDGGIPVEGALVCAKRDTIFASYTNSAGVATLNVLNTTSCSLLITVTGHNLKPFFGSCHVMSEGAYVSYLSHSVDDDSTGASAGNGDGVVDAGETIELHIWVKNRGSDTAHSVEGKLSTTDTFITITDSLKTFGTINPGDSTTGTSSYIFEVNPNIPDSQLVTFNLSCKDNLDSTWESNFSILIRHLIAITLNSPNGGETWLGGSVHPITWTTTGIGFDSYRLLYSLAPDSGWDTSACAISSPHPYPHNYDTTWLISHQGTQKIKLHFTNFATEAGYDFVYLYDKHANQIATYHGNLGAFWTQAVQGDTVKVRLVSNHSINDYGFDIDKYISFYTGIWDTIATDISPDNSSYNWTVPQDSSSTVKVKAQVLNYLHNIVAEDESDAYFTIIPGGTTLLPKTYELYQVYPNPATQKTIIRFQIPSKSKVSLRIYDVGGRLVKTLIDEQRKPGSYRVAWDYKDNANKQLPTGIYFYHLECTDLNSSGTQASVATFVDTKKLILIR